MTKGVDIKKMNDFRGGGEEGIWVLVFVDILL